MKRSLSLAALSLAAVLTLSACGADDGSTAGADTGSTDTSSSAPAAPATSAPGGASPSGDATASTRSDPAADEHNAADVMFAQMMLPHHEQAVEMSELMLGKDGVSPEIADLASRIKAAQGPEMDTMESWLETWDSPMGGEDGHGMGSMGSDSGSMGNMDGMGTGGMGTDGMGMGGMMSEDQMAELESADAPEASRMFLESMTAHHEGAIDMARTEIDNGEYPDALAMAETIVETQQAEIEEMKGLLADL
ncbi:DUF305 domain-containing protein [Arthrobacter echini]|uniref:DUF305 domain-containing protein n=2 Tax=Arthrobacter echini TaxID=1529066 RepID=A0A4S5E5R7_9MICC|nr:DUF305 domain-containing protein [Arthrobacter echini]THJ66864.1 DUF305 domain-containing protein [Arthrobacter echini]